MLSNRVHPVSSYLLGRADCARALTHTPTEKDRAEKTTTTTQHANKKTDDRQRTSSSVGLLGFLHLLRRQKTQNALLLLILIFSVLVANPKKLLDTVANPARGLLNRGKK